MCRFPVRISIAAWAAFLRRSTSAFLGGLPRCSRRRRRAPRQGPPRARSAAALTRSSIERLLQSFKLIHPSSIRALKCFFATCMRHDTVLSAQPRIFAASRCERSSPTTRSTVSLRLGSRLCSASCEPRRTLVRIGLVGILRVAQRRVFLDQRRRRPPPPQKVAAAVDHDRDEPGREAAPPAELLKPGRQRDADVLRDVLRVGRRADIAVGDAVDHLVMPLDEAAERLAIAGKRGGGKHAVVGRVEHLLHETKRAPRSLADLKRLLPEPPAAVHRRPRAAKPPQGFSNHRIANAGRAADSVPIL